MQILRRVESWGLAGSREVKAFEREKNWPATSILVPFELASPVFLLPLESARSCGASVADLAGERVNLARFPAVSVREKTLESEYVIIRGKVKAKLRKRARVI
jgi:hypothetical protein